MVKNSVLTLDDRYMQCSVSIGNRSCMIFLEPYMRRTSLPLGSQAVYKRIGYGVFVICESVTAAVLCCVHPD